MPDSRSPAPAQAGPPAVLPALQRSVSVISAAVARQMHLTQGAGARPAAGAAAPPAPSSPIVQGVPASGDDDVAALPLTGILSVDGDDIVAGALATCP